MLKKPSVFSLKGVKAFTSTKKPLIGMKRCRCWRQTDRETDRESTDKTLQMCEDEDESRCWFKIGFTCEERRKNLELLFLHNIPLFNN
jgi:hypothetical protein